MNIRTDKAKKNFVASVPPSLRSREILNAFDAGVKAGLAEARELMPRWVRVSERLPELSRDVPVMTREGTLAVAWRNTESVWRFCCGEHRTDIEQWFDLPLPEAE